MGRGKTYPDERTTHIDPHSKREVTRLTNYLGHSYQPYFTDPCWIDNDRSVLFRSERENRSNYFRCELSSGEITQLTDARHSSGCLSPTTNRLYYWVGSTLHELELDTLAERQVCEIPPPLRPSGGSQTNVTADGRHVCALLVELDNSVARSGVSMFDLRPRSQIVRIEVANGAIDVIHEERSYITHVNTSPTRSDLMTFCHEGPWERVEERIWGVNLDTGAVWNIRPQHGEYSIIAEHWFADGEHIGFRSHLRSANDTRFGHIRWDNEEHVEVVVPAYCRHYHSLDGSLVVGDGSPVYLLPKMINTTFTWPYILLYPWNGSTYAQPRILAYHGSTFNQQTSHPHPRITPDGKHVLYTTDVSGYANMYMVPIGDVTDLPILSMT